MSLKKEEGKKILNYLTKERKIANEIIEKFDFGYCPNYTDHQLKNRIITPIYDSYKNLVALSTRLIDKAEKNRFWHEAYDKSFYLYGLCYAKNRIIELNKSIVVEGEFDVAVLHSYGFNMTVGLCGSALSLFQISLLSRYCQNIYLMLDGDNSGKETIKRLMIMYNRYHLKNYGIKFIPVYISENMDPDAFVIQKGRNELMKLLKQSKDNVK